MLAHYGKQFAYTFVLFSGVGIIGQTGYEVYKESKRLDTVNSLYSSHLDRLQSEQKLQKLITAPIKGQYEMEWRTRSPIYNTESTNLNGTKQMDIQFNIYGSNGTMGVYTTQLLFDSETNEWKEHLTIVNIPKYNKSITLIDNRERIVPKKSGWFGFSSSRWYKN